MMRDESSVWVMDFMLKLIWDLSTRYSCTYVPKGLILVDILMWPSTKDLLSIYL